MLLALLFDIFNKNSNLYTLKNEKYIRIIFNNKIKILNIYAWFNKKKCKFTRFE